MTMMLNKKDLLEMKGFSNIWKSLTAKEKNKWCQSNLSNQMRSDFNEWYMNKDKHITEEGSRSLKYFNVKLEPENETKSRIEKQMEKSLSELWYKKVK